MVNLTLRRYLTTVMEIARPGKNPAKTVSKKRLITIGSGKNAKRIWLPDTSHKIKVSVELVKAS